MSAAVKSQLSQFALDVAEGLSGAGQKKIPPRYFYDDLGSALFEAITLLPEYGLTRAELRLIENYGAELFELAGDVSVVAELGSGSGKKARLLLPQGLARSRFVYCPIDLSTSALA